MHFINTTDVPKTLTATAEFTTMSDAAFRDEADFLFIGSPDIDLMVSSSLPDIAEVKRYYDIPFADYGVIIFHPVTTDLADTERSALAIADAVLESGREHVVIYPNNDEGCELIFNAWRKFEGNQRIKLLPSMRVEYFLVMLRSARYLLGNSSAGIRECPVFGVPAINVSTRQNGRANSPCIVNVEGKRGQILSAMDASWNNLTMHAPDLAFGAGNSAELFLKTIDKESFWQVSTQKLFNDI